MGVKGTKRKGRKTKGNLENRERKNIITNLSSEKSRKKTEKQHFVFIFMSFFI